MEIEAVAKLKYRDGSESILSYEGLDLIVKFKEKGKVFKTTLSEGLATTFYILNPHLSKSNEDIKTYDEYYNYVDGVLDNIEWVKECAEEMIREYFNDKSADDKKESRKKDTARKVAVLNKINIKVKL